MIFNAINSWDFLAWKINVGVGDENIFSHQALMVVVIDVCAKEKATCARTSIPRRVMFSDCVVRITKAQLRTFENGKSAQHNIAQWKSSQFPFFVLIRMSGVGKVSRCFRFH